jgi:Rod binding domain-containing protein
MDASDSITAVGAVAQSDTRGVPRLEQPKPPDEAAAKMRKLEQATNDFEALFLAHLLKPMAKSVAKMKMSEGSQLGGDVMIEVAMEKMAESIADKGGIGLGRLLFESLQYRVAAEDPVEDTLPNPLRPLRSERQETVDLESQGPPTPRPLQLEEGNGTDDGAGIR